MIVVKRAEAVSEAIKTGDKVLASPFGAVPVKFEGEDVFLVEEEDILAIL